MSFSVDVLLTINSLCKDYNEFKIAFQLNYSAITSLYKSLSASDIFKLSQLLAMLSFSNDYQGYCPSNNYFVRYFQQNYLTAISGSARPFLINESLSVSLNYSKSKLLLYSLSNKTCLTDLDWSNDLTTIKPNSS